MKKKKQSKTEDVTKKRSKPADDGWERLMKIREKLGKTAPSSEKPDDKVLERLGKIGKEIGKSWQSEKSTVEILSEMRR